MLYKVIYTRHQNSDFYPPSNALRGKVKGVEIEEAETDLTIWGLYWGALPGPDLTVPTLRLPSCSCPQPAAGFYSLQVGQNVDAGKGVLTCL